MSDTDRLKALADDIAERLGAKYASFSGYDVRADAGDAGMIYVALRGAKRDRDAGEAFADQVGALVERTLDEAADSIDFAVSLGAGNKDLLLQIELRQV